MAEFATFPFCVDNRRAKKLLHWRPRHKIVSELESTIAELKENPEKWFHERQLKLRPKIVRSFLSPFTYFWDRFFCPLILDSSKFVRAYLPLGFETLVDDSDCKDEYLAIDRGIDSPGEEVIFNLHRIELPCRVPWTILMEAIRRSWPPSMIRFFLSDLGYEYRLLGIFSLLSFEKIKAKTGSYVMYKVRSGFAANGIQVFAVRKDPVTGKHYLYVDTRVPTDQFFPVRFHNYYTSEHLQNLRRSLFGFALKKEESLLE